MDELDLKDATPVLKLVLDRKVFADLDRQLLTCTESCLISGDRRILCELIDSKLAVGFTAPQSDVRVESAPPKEAAEESMRRIDRLESGERASMSVNKWVLPSDLLTKSIHFMRPHGAYGNEGLVLWYGRRIAEDTVEVTHAVEPRGPGIARSPLHLSLSLRAMSALSDLGASLDRYLVGQIHSHPGTFIDLSAVDQDRGIRIQDYLSVVCPHYAQNSLTGFEDCGWHEFTQGRYRRVPGAQISSRIVRSSLITNAMHVEVGHD